LTKNIFSLNDSNRILNMRLHEIGIPPLHIVPVTDRNGGQKHYKLSEDKKLILPNITKGGDS
jgi:hypothetical protein